MTFDLKKTIENNGGYIVSEGTLRPQDLIPRFISALRSLCPEAYQQLMIPAVGFSAFPSYAMEDHDSEWWDSESCIYLLDEILFDTLNEWAPEGYYFGAQEGDGACFGFWRNDD